MIAKCASRDRIAAMDMHESVSRPGYATMAWTTLLYVADRFGAWCASRARVVWRNSDAFLGLFLLLVGVLNIHAARFCDGNSADYLSCTRPAVYYFYSGIDSALIIAGAFLLLIFRFSRPR